MSILLYYINNNNNSYKKIKETKTLPLLINIFNMLADSNGKEGRLNKYWLR